MALSLNLWETVEKPCALQLPYGIKKATEMRGHHNTEILEKEHHVIKRSYYVSGISLKDESILHHSGSCLVCLLLRHPSLRRHRIATALLLGHVILICHSLLLLRRHVVWMHLWIGWHTRTTLGREVLRYWFFGRLCWVLIIDTVFITSSWFGRIEASLSLTLEYIAQYVLIRGIITWMRFFPSAFVTRG